MEKEFRQILSIEHHDNDIPYATKPAFFSSGDMSITTDMNFTTHPFFRDIFWAASSTFSFGHDTLGPLGSNGEYDWLNHTFWGVFDIASRVSNGRLESDIKWTG